MSADNYYMIRNHPEGGYAAVMGFASDDGGYLWDDETDNYQFGLDGEPIPDPTWEPCRVDPKRDRNFVTFREAYEWAEGQYAEYGVRIHSEVDWGGLSRNNDMGNTDWLLTEANVELGARAIFMTLYDNPDRAKVVPFWENEQVRGQFRHAAIAVLRSVRVNVGNEIRLAQNSEGCFNGPGGIGCINPQHEGKH